MSRDDREDEPESRSFSARMWTTQRAPRPRGGNARMYDTSDGSGGTMRMFSTRRPAPTLSPREQQATERAWRYAAEDGENKRTGGWTAPWKPAPLPGTVKD